MLTLTSCLYRAQYNIIAEFLECQDMAAMLVSCRKIYLFLRKDEHFNKMRTEALLRFFFKQFMPTIPLPIPAGFYGEDVEMDS